MKYKKTAYKWHLVFTWTPIPLLGFLGMYFYGLSECAIGCVLGFLISGATSAWWKRAAYELEWSDIERAVRNIPHLDTNRIGSVEFNVKGKKTRIGYRYVSGVTSGREFLLWYKTAVWEGLLGCEDDALFTEMCGRKPARDVFLGKGKTFLVPKDQEKAPDACLVMLQHMISKTKISVGNIVASDKSIISSPWIDLSDHEQSAVPIVEHNFKGTLNGRPIVYVRDQKHKMILQEDGTMAPFEDFDSWWKQ